MGYNIADLFDTRERDRFALHSRYLNEQMVRVLKAIGYDVGFCHGEGQYLYDREGSRYLDLLSGFGVFAVGRNHPTLREALKSVLDSQLPNLVQMDVSTLAAILAERLLARVPYLDKAFFEFWIGGCRGGYQVRARGHRSPRHHLLRARLSRAFLWGVIYQRRRYLSQRLCTVPSWLHSHPL